MLFAVLLSLALGRAAAQQRSIGLPELRSGGTYMGADLRTMQADDFANPGVFHDVVTDFNNIRIVNDGMAFVVAFVPKGADIPQPDWAAQLPTLGAADGGDVVATTTTTVAGATTIAGATTTTVTGATTTEAVSTTTTAPATTTTGG